MDLPVDAVLADRYRIVEQRGRGGMAVVYAAHDDVLDRPVAVKVLAQHLLDDPRAVDRFEREARAAARLNHPNVVGVYDAASDGDTHFLVMELLEGMTLADRLRSEGSLSVDATLDVGEQVTAALAAAHAAGMVHRDVKPSNILLTPGGVVKVADFGIARAVASAATQTAVVMGSVPYVAPEQLDGTAGADPRSDLYALGCVLFECLCGRPPFVADTSAAVLGQHLHLAAPAVSARRPEVGAGVDAVVAGLLAKDPADRPESAEVLLAQLRRVRAGDPTDDEDRRGGAAAAAGLAGGVAGAAAAAAVAGAHSPDDPDAPTEVVGAGSDATEAIDEGAMPTEVIGDPAGTAVLPGSATVAGAGAASGSRTPEPDDRDDGMSGWWIAAIVLLVLALGIWAWATWFDGDDPAIGPTPAVTTPAPTEPAVVPTTAPPVTTDPTTTAPAQPTTAPATTAPPSPSPSPTPAPTTPPPTPAPTTPPPTTPSPSPTAAALAHVRDLLGDAVGRGQLSDAAADAIGARVTAVDARLASGDADRVEQARAGLVAVRQEIDDQVAAGEANRGVANQLQAEVDDLAALLA